MFEQLTDQDYRDRQRRLVAVGGSDLSGIGESLAHWLARKRRTPSEAMLRGTAIHCAVLEPERFASEYSRAPAVYKDAEGFEAAKGRGEAPAGPWKVENSDTWHKLRKDAKVAAGGGLSDSEWQLVVDSAAAVAAHSVAGPLLARCITERAVFFRDDTGLHCCAKVDAFDEERRILVDLKTTNRTIGPARAAKWIVDSGYHAQLAHYAEGCGDVAEVLIVAVEALQPHAVAVYRLSPLLLELGAQRRREALDKLAAWDRVAAPPAYEAKIHDIEPPRWAVTDEARRRLEDKVRARAAVEAFEAANAGLVRAFEVAAARAMDADDPGAGISTPYRQALANVDKALQAVEALGASR